MDMLEAAGEALKAVLLPDVQAWGDIVQGDATAGDYVSAGMDVASMVPGGVLLKAGSKGARALMAGDRFADAVKGSLRADGDAVAARIPGRVGDEARWRRNPLWSGHTAEEAFQPGEVIQSTNSLGLAGRGNVVRHEPDSVPWKLIRDKINPELTQEEARSLGVRTGLGDFPQLRKRMIPSGDHSNHAFATDEISHARSYSGLADSYGAPGRVYRVVPVKPRRTFISTERGVRRERGNEVWSSDGFRVLGQVATHPPHPTQVDLPMPSLSEWRERVLRARELELARRARAAATGVNGAPQV